MKTLLIISIIALVISIIYSLIQKEKISKLVEDNESLKITICSIRKTSEIQNGNLNKALESAVSSYKGLESKNLLLLSRLSDIGRNWRSRLTFYNPKPFNPTLVLKYNADDNIYELFRIGSKIPLAIDYDFVFGDKTLTEIIGEFEKPNSSL